MSNQTIIGEARTHPILFAGYGLLVALLLAATLGMSAGFDKTTLHRMAFADRVTTILAYVALVAIFIRVFGSNTGTVDVSRAAVHAIILGIIVEGAGLALHGMYWAPWYLGKVNGNTSLVVFSESNTWMVTPIFILIWIGIGFTANLCIRAIMGRHHVYWPLLWSAFVIATWCIAYHLPAAVG